MKLYLAGNFPQFADSEKEKECANFVESKYGTYRRLVSYFFKDTCELMIELKKEKENIGEKYGSI